MEAFPIICSYPLVFATKAADPDINMYASVNISTSHFAGSHLLLEGTTPPPFMQPSGKESLVLSHGKDRLVEEWDRIENARSCNKLP